MNEEMIQRTDTGYAPWTIIEAQNKDYAALKILNTVADRLEAELKKKAQGPRTELFEGPVPPDKYKNGVLSKSDLTKSLEEKEYRKKMDQLQKKLEILHSELYRLRIPVVLGFEGWDAAGKGGAIRRLTLSLIHI